MQENKQIDMAALPEVKQIVAYQREWTILWHQTTPKDIDHGFYHLVAANHHWNYALWHEEDKARRDDQGFEYVYRAKRNIDRYNQSRNDMMEAMDRWIEQHYIRPVVDQETWKQSVPVHSETPGMMIDRLSILALKAYHMDLQTKRVSASVRHRQQCKQKSNLIQVQLGQLADCLNNLLQECLLGTRTFCCYHQFKMYNDPSLNPQLYQAVEDG